LNEIQKQRDGLWLCRPAAHNRKSAFCIFILFRGEPECKSNFERSTQVSASFFLLLSWDMYDGHMYMCACEARAPSSVQQKRLGGAQENDGASLPTVGFCTPASRKNAHSTRRPQAAKVPFSSSSRGVEGRRCASSGRDDGANLMYLMKWCATPAIGRENLCVVRE